MKKFLLTFVFLFLAQTGISAEFDLERLTLDLVFLEIHAFPGFPLFTKDVNLKALGNWSMHIEQALADFKNENNEQIANKTQKIIYQLKEIRDDLGIVIKDITEFIMSVEKKKSRAIKESDIREIKFQIKTFEMIMEKIEKAKKRMNRYSLLNNLEITKIIIELMSGLCEHAINSLFFVLP